MSLGLDQATFYLNLNYSNEFGVDAHIACTCQTVWESVVAPLLPHTGKCGRCTLRDHDRSADRRHSNMSSVDEGMQRHSCTYEEGSVERRMKERSDSNTLIMNA